jgi:hypothetical protein
MGNPGIVDQDGDGAELRLDGVEGALDRVAVEDVGLHGDDAAARCLDPGRHPGEPIPASRHQSDGSAVGRQKLGETSPKAARRAGHQRHPSGDIEQFRCSHVDCRFPPIYFGFLWKARVVFAELGQGAKPVLHGNGWGNHGKSKVSGLARPHRCPGTQWLAFPRAAANQQRH